MLWPMMEMASSYDQEESSDREEKQMNWRRLRRMKLPERVKILPWKPVYHNLKRVVAISTNAAFVGSRIRR